jgi:hypothetical protein
MSFTLDIKNFVEKAKKNPETVARAVSFKLFSAIIKGTPVGEVNGGRLRLNWQVAGATPATGMLDGLDKSGDKAVASAAEYIFNTAVWYDFTMANNLDYAPVVEYGGYPGDGPNTVGGFSKQAPSGMVRVNVARFNTLLEEEAAKVK